MKFTCTKENLSKVLNLACPLASRQGHLPIIMNILINAGEVGVEIVATNLEVAVKTNLRAKVDEKGSFTVPAKTLLDYINLLPDNQIEFSLKNNELIVKCVGSSTKIKGAPAEDFPVVPEIDEKNVYTIAVNDFREALSKTVIAAAKNEIRPELSGVYMSLFGPQHKGLVMASTDSYRLAEAKVDIEQGENQIEAIVPARTVYEIIRLLNLSKESEGEKNVRVWLSENQIAVRYDGFEMTSRLVEGNYPDYTQIIPDSFKTIAVFPPDVMVKAIKAASIFTSVGVNAVSFDLGVDTKTVAVSSTNAQTGEHNSEVDADISGEENSILLNHRYVLDGLQQINGEVEFGVNGSDAPCIFKEKGKKDYIYIVMPIRQ